MVEEREAQAANIKGKANLFFNKHVMTKRERGTRVI